MIEFVVIRRLYARPLDTILATWGVSLVLVQLIIEIYGAGQHFLDLPTVSATTVLGTPYSTYRLILIVLAAGMIAALALIVRFTTVGLTIRAVMSERAARAQPRDQHGARAAADVHHRRRARRASRAPFSARSRASTRTSARRSSPPASSPSCSRAGRSSGSCSRASLLATVQTIFSRYENAVWANAVVIGTAVVILRFRPQGLALKRTT